jgi:hypothetical protein
MDELGKPSKDDYDLTLTELRSQRIQLLLQLEAVGASIRHYEGLVASFPPKQGAGGK